MEGEKGGEQKDSAAAGGVGAFLCLVEACHGEVLQFGRFHLVELSMCRSEVGEMEGGDAEDLVQDEGVGQTDFDGGALPCLLT